MSALSFHSELEDFLKQKRLGLHDLVYGIATPAVLEKKWLEAFSEKEFAELGLTRFFPRMVRGLPRVYLRDDPSACRVKKEFTDLAALKRLGAVRALYSLYRKWELAKGAKLALFTPDLALGSEVIRIFRDRFPHLEIRSVALSSENPVLKGDALASLRTSDCILQMSRCKTHDSQERLKKMEISAPLPRWIGVGEYGSVESHEFHPKSGRYALGLHCLEQGVLIRKSKMGNLDELSDENLKRALFANEVCFYLACLATESGGMVYLQALLRGTEHDPKPLLVVSPDIHWLIRLTEERKLKELEGLCELEIHFKGLKYTSQTGKRGKKLILFCPEKLTEEDFQILMHLSGEFVGVDNDQSLSEAISANKAFFYDCREQAQHFIRDLAALAENRIGAHRNALMVFRAMRKAFLHRLPLEETEWVEESHFQEREPLPDLGLQIGLALQDPDTVAGFKKLNRVIADDYCANDFLVSLVQREFCHASRPDIARAEEVAIQKFAAGESDFKECFSQIAAELQLENKFQIWKMRPMDMNESRDLHQRLGKSLRNLIDAIAKEEEEIKKLSRAIGGSIEKEADSLVHHLKATAKSALHLEQEMREL